MSKPDYIPFSQEIFDELEGMRLEVIRDKLYKLTPEFKEKSFRLMNEVFSNEYTRYIKEVYGKSK